MDGPPPTTPCALCGSGTKFCDYGSEREVCWGPVVHLLIDGPFYQVSGRRRTVIHVCSGHGGIPLNGHGHGYIAPQEER